MKILLVNPPTVHEVKGPHPFRSEDMGTFPHLGLMYISAVLLQDGGFEVKLVDMALEKLGSEQLIPICRDFSPDVIGLSSYTDCLYDLKMLVDEIRKTIPSVFICAGGPHVEVYPEETLKALAVDCIIRGDGEYSFLGLCRKLREREEWRGEGGVGYRTGTTVHMNPPHQVENLDELPFPARALSSMEKVSSSVSRGGRITSICSSRGCPFPCTFCNSPYKKYRLRSPGNVAAEIEVCHDQFKIKEFFFFDDLFNLDKERVMAMCSAIKGLHFPISWSFRGRINCLDEEALLACKEAGCNRIHFGVEAGTERILELYRKGISLQDVRTVFSLCKKTGIETVGNFMFGAPTETRQEMEETIAFALDLDPTFVEFHVLVPYPYTEIYHRMQTDGNLNEDLWQKYALNPQPEFYPPLCEDNLTSAEMYRLLNNAYRCFYFRPTYIFRQMMQLTSITDAFNKVKGAYNMRKAIRD